MSNYPNMSYCMFENTHSALDQIKDFLQEELEKGNTLKDIQEEASQYEGPYIEKLRSMMEELLELYNDLDPDYNDFDIG